MNLCLIIVLTDNAVVDAETAIKGYTVFSVSATDPEDDVLNFTMTCDPDGTFKMSKSMKTMCWSVKI